MLKEYNMRVAIGSDDAGYALREVIREHLQGCRWIVLGSELKRNSEDVITGR